MGGDLVGAFASDRGKPRRRESPAFELPKLDVPVVRDSRRRIFEPVRNAVLPNRRGFEYVIVDRNHPVEACSVTFVIRSLPEEKRAIP